MTKADFEYLITPQAQQLIEQNLDLEPTTAALKLRNAALATQIKNLQRCARKLPSYHAARCIMPTVSYQQSSSEAVSRHTKNQISGHTALDLTCGLGVDSMMLAQNFDKVIALEIDPIRAEIARYNFSKLGITNIEVLTIAAEDFISQYQGSIIDLTYADPARRNDQGKSIYSLEDSSPRIMELLPRIKEISAEVVLKLSPLFDVDQALRLFGAQTLVEVVSLANECKEVIVRIVNNSVNKPYLLTIISNSGDVSRFEFVNNSPIVNNFRCAELNYIHIPDVAFYKSRTTANYLQQFDCEFDGGYAFSSDPIPGLCGQSFRIVSIHSYQPRQLKKLLTIRRATIHLKDFPYTTAQICKNMAITEGGNDHLFFTKFRDELVVIRA